MIKSNLININFISINSLMINHVNNDDPEDPINNNTLDPNDPIFQDPYYANPLNWNIDWTGIYGMEAPLSSVPSTPALSLATPPESFMEDLMAMDDYFFPYNNIISEEVITSSTEEVIISSTEEVFPWFYSEEGELINYNEQAVNFNVKSLICRYLIKRHLMDPNQISDNKISEFIEMHLINSKMTIFDLYNLIDKIEFNFLECVDNTINLANTTNTISIVDYLLASFPLNDWNLNELIINLQNFIWII